jgi:glycosyltransferase involved in cell wall biosynthesis
MRRIQAALAFLAVGCTYGLALVVCRLARRKDASPWSVSGRIAVCGTFHNPSWFRSHTTPLGLSVTREVVVVTDSEQPAVERVRLAHLSPWLSRTLGRPLAKLVRLVELGRRERPDLYMGYHLIPNSVIALVASRLFARPSCYQMTAGPNEVEGGGFRNDNAVLSRLQRPSQLLERLALAVVREFDLVVVRGAGAERFLAERGVSRIAVIRGSVDPDRFAPAPERPYHLLYVGQLIERKQPL